MLPEPEAAARLAAAGWQRRFIADPERAREAIALYEALGYEVHAEPLTPAELGPACRDCQLLACRQYVTLYTRRKER
ncbi:MAG: hypothetical protein KatS3mg131_3568 [Candidatus Tectimicrobiota bacterium]|nr:MAG: hypothetical protein KatS3mg131_3568 [Candidatus Tectomicrobia bacterium]